MSADNGTYVKCPVCDGPVARTGARGPVPRYCSSNPTPPLWRRSRRLSADLNSEELLTRLQRLLDKRA